MKASLLPPPAAPLPPPVSRFTFHVSRFTPHVSRFPRAGFTLIEILMATAILLVIGGVAATILMQSFTLWEHGVARTRKLAATDDFATQIARDFASAQGGMGFVGESGQCRFWSIEARDAGPPQLVAVAYELKPAVILRRATSRSDATVLEQRYAPVEALALRYGAPEAPADDWRDAWMNPTNAPTRLSLQSAQLGSRHLLLRRTP
jgi:prepilin-type N-terminal cleavage/methylation domain-containing protein